MQEEISKHSKKALKVMGNKGITLPEKIKEIVIEIFIIVFAVTLSISLHSWSEKRHQQQEAKEFLLDLKKDLAIDKVDIEKSIININKNIRDYNFLNNLTKRNIDSLKDKIIIAYRTQNTKSSGGNYEGFKSSGKLGFIENKNIKTKILNYYQQTIPDINSLELLFKNKNDYFFDNVILNFSVESDKRFLNRMTNVKLQMLIAISNDLSHQYQNAVEQINLIDKEINKDYTE